jgi:hypothetical protein
MSTNCSAILLTGQKCRLLSGLAKATSVAGKVSSSSKLQIVPHSSGSRFRYFVIDATQAVLLAVSSFLVLGHVMDVSDQVQVHRLPSTSLKNPPTAASIAGGLAFLRCGGAIPPAATRSRKTHVAHRRTKIERVYRPYLTATEAAQQSLASTKRGKQS